MATNSDQKGYDHQFLDQIPDELLCLICTLIARDPQQATCCGKVYCKACIDELAEHSKKCPQCREDINCFPDKRSKPKLAKINSVIQLGGLRLGATPSCLEDLGVAPRLGNPGYGW